MSNSILIIGGGLAGLFTALKLAPLPVTVLSGPPITKSTASAWAQGGIAAALGPEDSAEAHIQDTIEAGAGLVDENVARIMARDAPDRIMDLVEFGVPFDRTSSGFFSLGREGAHSQNRIVRVSGDRAGAAVMQAVAQRVRATDTIRLIEGYSACKLESSNGEITGAVAFPLNKREGELIRLKADNVVLATGGVGGLYSVTTNPKSVRGEGLGMALRAGAVAADCEFVQFHPTGIDIDRDPAPLATEALRGEGAILLNGENVRFMKSEHSLAELAPRDIVAMAIHRERLRTGKVYLDCSESVGADFKDRFPTVFASCQTADIDPSVSPIPVAPAAHYHMGGIATDIHGESNLRGLWACGEVASTGAHGANRLASNSLLEALVFGSRIADRITDRLGNNSAADVSVTDDTTPSCPIKTEEEQTISELRRVMSDNVGVVRDAESLRAALSFIEASENRMEGDVTANVMTAAKAVTVAALLREESRGGHYRSDYPSASENFHRRSTITMAEADKTSGLLPTDHHMPRAVGE